MLQGPHIFEIGNFGSIIVAAPDQNATTVVYYTIDQGLTWHNLEISEEPLHVVRISIKSTNTTSYFLIQGRRDGQKHEGIILAVDFATLNIRACNNLSNPDDPNSDYEKWTATSPLPGNCLMGHKTTYIRRKRDAQCIDNLQFNRIFSSSNCECTEEDWECDVGHERTKGGLCERVDTSLLQLHLPQSYRKIPGNTCEGGVIYEQNGFNLLYLVVLVVLGVIAAVMSIFFLKRTIFKDNKYKYTEVVSKVGLHPSLSQDSKEAGENQEIEMESSQKS